MIGQRRASEDCAAQAENRADTTNRTNRTARHHTTRNEGVGMGLCAAENEFSHPGRDSDTMRRYNAFCKVSCVFFLKRTATMENSDLYAELPVTRLRLPVPSEKIDAILDATCLESPAPGAFEDLQTGRAWIEAFGVDAAQLDHLADVIRAAATAAGVPEDVPVERTHLPREDWAESWKRFFKTLRVSARVTVRPPWETYEPTRSDEIVVVIEPGMSFGTGLHGTTQACLQFLEKLADEGPGTRSVADFGCGSGILSIAARKLGFRDVLGLDYDVAAVRISGENALANGVGDIVFRPCDVTTDSLPVSDIVVANILAPVLIAAAPRIAGAVSRKPDSALILSGILTEQYPDVRAAYLQHGFRECSSRTIAEWTSGLFRRI